MRRILCGGLLAAAVLSWIAVSSGPVIAGDEPGAKTKRPDPGSPMDEDAKKYAAMAAPGEHHKHLDALVGRWNAVARFWMSPDATPEESKATLTRKWVLGGRFLMQEFEGTAMGQPFHGIGYIGYDNTRKQYQTVWMDTMDTGMMREAGTCDASGKVFTFQSKSIDPATGQECEMKSITRIVSPDKNVFEMYVPGADGKLWRNMEIVYTR
ncbi:MAG: DUF1579 family protein [Phycisphaerae bacterium]|nr:DUF1579 family protein [Phycisphaerae bacterium]